MGTIIKRGKTYRATVSWHEDGVRKFKSKSGFKTKREAQIYVNELENLKARNFISQNSKTPFPEYFKTLGVNDFAPRVFSFFYERKY